MKYVAFVAVLVFSVASTLGQAITPEAVKLAQEKLAQKQAQRATATTAPAAPQPSEKPAVTYRITNKRFDGAKAFGKQAIILDFSASDEVGEFVGNVIIKDLKGVTRGTIAVTQDVQFKSFAMRIDYEAANPFLLWLKNTPLEDMRVSVEATGGATRTEEVAEAPPVNVPPVQDEPAAAAKRPPRVAFVVDTSGTMGPHLGPIRTELKKAVRDLADGQPFNVYLGGFTVVPFSKTFVGASDTTRNALYKFIEDTVAKQSSELEKAVIAACQLRPDVIWLITDGDINSTSIKESAIKMVEAAKASRTRINCVLNYVDHAEHRTLLAQICNSTGGRCWDEKANDVTARYGSEPLTRAPVTAVPEPRPADIPSGKSVFSDK